MQPHINASDLSAGRIEVRKRIMLISNYMAGSSGRSSDLGFMQEKQGSRARGGCFGVI